MRRARENAVLLLLPLPPLSHPPATLVPGGNQTAISLTRLAYEERNSASWRAQGSSH